MKAIKLNAIITSLRSKVDGSLGLTMSTPELTVEEKAEFMRLQGQNLNVLVEPIDEPTELLKIDKDVDKKTQAQRVRAVLFVLWKQQGSGEFRDFYYNETEKYINTIKDRKTRPIQINSA